MITIKNLTEVPIPAGAPVRIYADGTGYAEVGDGQRVPICVVDDDHVEST